MDNEEEYLQEKINRATPHWTGVDTQEYINKVRGREMEEEQRKRGSPHETPSRTLRR